MAVRKATRQNERERHANVAEAMERGEEREEEEERGEEEERRGEERKEDCL